MSANALPAKRCPPAAWRLPVVAAGVIVLHGAALWALDRGLFRPPVQVVVPPMLVKMIAPAAPPALPAAPAPRVEPPPPAAPTPPVPPVTRRAPPPPRPAPSPRPAPVPAPQPLAVADVAANTQAEEALAAPQPQAAQAQAQSADSGAAAAAAPASAPAALLVVPPSSNAAYLSNPKPVYPVMSRRLGEAGRVIIHALIGTDGRVREARIQRSSGFDRLDQVALETARDHWRYVPGTHNGVPQAMWFDVPIDFVLNQAREP